MPFQIKKQSIFSKLGAGLRTPKGRLVATVLVFGAIGGGILVYKSFAATPPSYQWNYTVDAGNVGTSSTGGTCTYRNLPEPAKNRMNVVNQVCSSNIWGDFVATYIKGSYLPTNYTKRNYRICAYVKGVSTKFEVGIGVSGKWSRVNHKIYDGNYGYYCSNYIYLTAASSISGEVYSNGASPSNITVGTIVLEMQ